MLHVDLAVLRTKGSSISATSVVLPSDVVKESEWSTTEMPYVDLAISRTKGGSISVLSALLPLDVDKKSEWETSEILPWTSP